MFKNSTPDAVRARQVAEVLAWLAHDPQQFAKHRYHTVQFKFIPPSPKWVHCYVQRPEVPRMAVEWFPTPFTEWLDAHPWPQGKKKELMLAKEEALTINDCVIDNFVKKECYPKFCDGLLAAKPRPISSRSPPFQSRLGPVCYRLGERFNEIWNGYSNQKGIRIIYTCGMTGQQLGKEVQRAIDRAGEQCIKAETDASTFDGSMSLELLSLPMFAYQMLGIDETAVELLYKEMETKGRTRGGSRYWYVGRRNSGDGDTSCGNSATNALTHKFLLHRTGMFIENDSTIFVLGDDNLMILRPSESYEEDAFRKALETGLTKFGMIPKMEIREQFEFCSGLFYPVNLEGERTLVWGPKIGRILYKTGFVKKETSLKNMKREIVGTFKGLQLTIGHIPILRTYMAKIFTEYGNNGEPSHNPYNLLVTTQCEMIPETQEFIMDRYQISERELRQLEGEIEGCNLPHGLSEKFDAIIKMDNTIGDCGAVLSDCLPSVFWRTLKEWRWPLLVAASLFFGTTLAASTWQIYLDAFEKMDGMDPQFYKEMCGRLAQFIKPDELATKMFIGVTAPVLEELYKTKYPHLRHAVGLHEFFTGLWFNPALHYILGVDPTTGLNYSLPTRLFSHMAFNWAYLALNPNKNDLCWLDMIYQICIWTGALQYEPDLSILHLQNTMRGVLYYSVGWPAMVVNQAMAWLQ